MGRLLLLAVALLGLAAPALAEDGHEAWLRYHALPAAQIARYAPQAATLVIGQSSSTLDAAAKELRLGIAGLLRRTPVSARAIADGAVVIGTPA